MMKMRKGCTVPFPEKLFEAYEVEGNSILANVGADKIEEMLLHFIFAHEEPQFFILELPANLANEEKIKEGTIDKFHEDVYYIDGCSPEQAQAILTEVGDVLINDGLCSFGFGCHKSGDEIMFGKYNVVTIFSRNIAGFESFFEKFHISRVDHLLTAWDTFSQDHPGISERYEANGKTVFDIPELLKDRGIYFAQRRE